MPDVSSKAAAWPKDRTQWIAGGPLGILLIHGLGGSPAELAPLTRALGDAGHTVCTVQLAGHGRSEGDLAASTATDWCESALAAHTVLARRCERVIVCGLSVGALIAAEIAHARPKRVDGLVLLAPVLQLDGWAMPRADRDAGHRAAGLVPRSATLAECPPYGLKDARVRSLVLACLQRGSAGGVIATSLKSLGEFKSLAADVRRHLSKIKQPTLIIHPREDDMASLANAHEIATHLGGLVETLVLDDSYHLITLDRQRRLVCDRVSEFVGRFAVKAAGSGSRPGHVAALTPTVPRRTAEVARAETVNAPSGFQKPHWWNRALSAHMMIRNRGKAPGEAPVRRA